MTDPRLVGEVAELAADNRRLEAENTRAWAQIERLTETVTQLALPPAREEAQEDQPQPDPEPAQIAPTPEPEKPRRSAWDWFLGRDRRE